MFEKRISPQAAGFSCVVFALLGLSLECRGDWPAFRGPTRDGQIRNLSLPLEWSTTEGIRWRSPIDGIGWSSPVVVAQRIYLTTAIPVPDAGFDLALIILDAESGAELKRQVLFSQPSDAPRIHKKNSHASPTPVFDGQNLFLHFGHQGTACVDLDGQVLWKNDQLDYPPVHGNGGSPALVGEHLIFSRDGGDISQITALHKATGEIAWELERDVEVDRPFSFCTPQLIEVGGKAQLVLPGSNVVQALDPVSGKELWRVTYDGYSVIPRPIYEAGLIFICTGYNRPSLLAIDPTGKGDVTETHLRWQNNSNVPHTPSLLGFDGKIVMVSDRGIATCVDAQSGAEIWKQRVGGDYSASPLQVDSRIYFLSEQGTCTVVDASDGATLAVSKMEERCLASLAVVDDDFLLRSDEALYRITRQ